MRRLRGLIGGLLVLSLTGVALAQTPVPATKIGEGSPGSAGLDWQIVGVGDFNGDGKADILWRHYSGLVYVWLLDGVTLIGEGSPGSAGLDWTIAGIGDVNGDKVDDVVWRQNTGLVYIWLMGGASTLRTTLPAGVTPPKRK